MYSLLLLLASLSSESNVRVMVPKLSQWQALPWDAKQIYVAFMSWWVFGLISYKNQECQSKTNESQSESQWVL